MRLQKISALRTSSFSSSALQRLALGFLISAAAAAPFLPGHRDDPLENLLQRGGRRRDGDLPGVHQEGVGEAADFGRHGGREEQGLAHLGQQADDALHIGYEAHVEHPVGLVDDQDFHVAEQQHAAVEQVDQPPRRRDQHVDAPVDELVLVVHGLAADDQRLGELVVLAVGVEILGDLGGELPGRLEDQRPGHPGARPAGGQDVDHRQGERRGLAGAGLRAAEDVASHQDMGDGLRLDRRRIGVARVGNRAEDLFA